MSMSRALHHSRHCKTVANGPIQNSILGVQVAQSNGFVIWAYFLSIITDSSYAINFRTREKVYSNEEDLGEALRDSGVPIQEVFVTSKIVAPHNRWSYDEVVQGVRLSNQKLGLEYIDLYLLHAPFDSATRAEAWKALEDMQTQGIVRDIGVSSFGELHLQKLSETWRVEPAVNQVELHPWLARADTVKYCEEQGILMEAYSPLARAQKMHDRTLKQIASEVGATSAQVLIAWSLAKGFVTLLKTVTESRIKENLEAAKVELSSEQIEKLNRLDSYFVTCFDAPKLPAV